MQQCFPITSKVRVTAPAREPVSLAEAKLHLRVDGSADDITISALISMAREWAEEATDLALVPQTWDFFWGQFPGIPPYRDADQIIFPLNPVQAVLQFAFTQSNAAIVNWTVAGANLLNDSGVLNAHIDLNTVPARIRLAYSCVWPNQVLQTANGVRIRCAVGFPAWSGTVTKAGNVIQLAAGDAFDTTWTAGKRIVIAGVPVILASVTDATHLVILSPDADLADGNGLSYSADDIPEKPRSAMKLLIGHLWENREAVTDGTLTVGAVLPMGVADLLATRKVWAFI